MYLHHLVDYPGLLDEMDVTIVFAPLWLFYSRRLIHPRLFVLHSEDIFGSLCLLSLLQKDLFQDSDRNRTDTGYYWMTSEDMHFLCSRVYRLKYTISSSGHSRTANSVKTQLRFRSINHFEIKLFVQIVIVVIKRSTHFRIVCRILI